MKLKSMILPMLAIAALTSCNNDDDLSAGSTMLGDKDVAYLSIKVQTQLRTRGSSEDAGAGESDLKSLYLVTFDKNEAVIGIPGTNDYFIKLEGAEAIAKPAAQKVAATAARLLVIANPGEKLLGALNGLKALTTFKVFNAAIKEATVAELTDIDLETGTVERGFAMINSGSEEGKDAGTQITDPLINIESNIVKVTKDVDEEKAKADASEDTNRAKVQIERLASKIEFMVKDQVDAKGATFTFQNWTLDGVNKEFYPFAKKNLLSVTHTATDGSYVKNFYTEDPNFSGDVTGEGLEKATIEGDYAPKLPAPYTWMEKGDKAYCIENTMAADKQLYGNATRVVIKATYYPEGHSGTGDWFRFADVNYPDFDALKDAYTKSEAESNLRKACDDFSSQIAKALPSSGVTKFDDLTADILKDVDNGGQAVKNGKNPVIRWYKDGLCYYYYEIRHDNDATDRMTLGKYGVVRNNWYSLTLGTVDGPGTPWYPDIDNPGPGDPDPEDPIDPDVAFLGITINVAQWILWENEIKVGV